jgi:hypothetical protein
MLVESMERHGHLDLDPVVNTKVWQASAATIDRRLADVAFAYRRDAHAPRWRGAAIGRSIPVRTFADWRDGAKLLGDRHSQALRRSQDRR